MEGQKTELKIIRMSEVESQEVKWLWYPFIPYGKLTIIQGDPGDGKTTLVLNIAAKLSKGECLDSDMDVQEPVNVIYQTAEDGLADTVKPRLELAGADCEKILVIDESDKSLSMADERLEEALAKTGAKVLILDPIQAYLGGGMDMNRANEARDMTKKLGALAEKYQCAILLIGHMNKASGNKAAYRGMGSIDFFAVLNKLGKEWWIDMKNVQISEELFVAIMRYFMLEQEEMLPQIKQGLEKKLDAMVMRELYTKYKTAPTEEEKEKARKEYLDRRGVPESFRW